MRVVDHHRHRRAERSTRRTAISRVQLADGERERGIQADHAQGERQGAKDDEQGARGAHGRELRVEPHPQRLDFRGRHDGIDCGDRPLDVAQDSSTSPATLM